MTKDQTTEAAACMAFLEKALQGAPDHIDRDVGVTALARLHALIGEAHGAVSHAPKRRGRTKKAETQEGATP